MNSISDSDIKITIPVDNQLNTITDSKIENQSQSQVQSQSQIQSQSQVQSQSMYLAKTRRDEIIETISEQNYSDIKRGLFGRSCWKITGDITETIAHICIGASSIIAFASGFFGISYLAFISGSLSTASVLLLKLSSYSMRESKERTEEINRILTKLGLDTIVDISIDSAGGDVVTMPSNNQPYNKIPVQQN